MIREEKQQQSQRGTVAFNGTWLLNSRHSHARTNEVVADRVVNQRNNRIDSQLSHHGRAMSFHSLDADAEHRGNFLVGLGLSEQLNDLTFAVRQYRVLCFMARGLQ